MGILGIDDIADGLSGLSHGVTEGVGDFADNTTDAAGGWLESGGHTLDGALPGPDVFGAIGGAGNTVLDNYGNVIETTSDVVNMVASTPADGAVTGLNLLGDTVDLTNAQLNNLGDLSNGVLNGDMGAFGDYGNTTVDNAIDFGDSAMDHVANGPLGPEQFTEHYLENDWFDLTDEGQAQSQSMMDGWEGVKGDITATVDGLPGELHSLLDGPVPGTGPGILGGIPGGLPGLFGGGSGSTSGGSGSSGGSSGSGGSAGSGGSGGSAGSGAGPVSQGMNRAAAEEVAQALVADQQSLAEVITAAGAAVTALAAAWQGPDAQKYQQQWSAHAKELQACVDRLTAMQTALRADIGEQQGASTS